MDDMIICSACLIGVRCRYDGSSQLKQHVLREFLKGNVIPVCPELLGGLGVTRLPSEITNGDGESVLNRQARVLTCTGKDVTEMFMTGASRVANMAKVCGVEEAILKDGSPSCGSTYIYDGSFSKTRRPGIGVTTAALKRLGIRINPVK